MYLFAAQLDKCDTWHEYCGHIGRSFDGFGLISPSRMTETTEHSLPCANDSKPNPD